MGSNIDFKHELLLNIIFLEKFRHYDSVTNDAIISK
jgi:hypothetical protein